VTTLKDIPKGSIVLLETPFAHTIHHRYRSTTCEHCFRFLSIDSEESLSHPCLSNCGKHYCSLSCRRIGRARHNSTSCGLSIQVNALKNNNRLMHEALSLLINISSNSTRPISNLLGMMKDSSKKSKRDCELQEAKFRQLNHFPNAVLEDVGVYADALSTRKLNSIGIFNESGDEIGYALSPVLAMVNHSCLPNCQQVTVDGSCRLVALRDIERGEELSYSYVSILHTNAERRAAIAFNWEFTCTCQRCRGTVDCSAFDAEHACCCGAICLTVDRSTQECVCNLPSVI
jgi:hypothetical protein